jgi:HEAT repeat protein
MGTDGAGSVQLSWITASARKECDVFEHTATFQTATLPPPADLAALIATLGSENAVQREKARNELLALGRPAVEPLVKSLGSKDNQVRWEAAKALGSLPDPAAAPALVAALEDERLGVRWLAAEALVALGRDALRPLLQAMSNPIKLRGISSGAHHVLHALAGRASCRPIVTPLLAALRGYEPGIWVTRAAREALRRLEA